LFTDNLHLLTAPKPASERYVIEHFVGTIAQWSDYYAWRRCTLGTGQHLR